ncbi:MAG: DNA repair protein RecO [Planctomycetia bacterium]
MIAEKDRALVIRATPFGETSSVVTLYCREFGKLRALAKGAWRPKSGFDGGLDLLSACQVLVLRRRSGGLDLLTEACLEHRFRIGSSFLAFLGGMHVADLLDSLTADADPIPELFDAAHATLRDLSAAAADAAWIQPRIVHCELAILRGIGNGPALFACAECGGPLPAAGRIAVAMLAGGTVCGRCRSGKRAVVSVSAAAVDALRGLSAAEFHRAASVWPAATAGEVRAVMTTYLAHLLGRPPRVAGRLQPRPERRRTDPGSRGAADPTSA